MACFFCFFFIYMTSEMIIIYFLSSVAYKRVVFLHACTEGNTAHVKGITFNKNFRIKMSLCVVGQFALRDWFYWEISPEYLPVSLYRQETWGFVRCTVAGRTVSLTLTNASTRFFYVIFNSNFWPYVKSYFRTPCVLACRCQLVWPETSSHLYHACEWRFTDSIS